MSITAEQINVWETKLREKLARDDFGWFRCKAAEAFELIRLAKIGMEVESFGGTESMK